MTCEYCGAIATVQRRSQILQRVLPPPVQASSMPFAVQHRSSAGGAFVAAVMLVVLAGVGGAVWMFAARAKSAAAPSRQWTWEGGGAPILRGDLVIGRRRSYTPDEIDLAGLDAATGAVRWNTPALGNYNDTYQGTLVLDGDTLVFASDRGKVTALDPTTGATRWTAALPERPRHFCAATKGVLVIVTADDVRRPTRLSDGQPTDDPPDKPCTRIPQDRKDVQWDDADGPQEMQQAAAEWTGKIMPPATAAHALSPAGATRAPTSRCSPGSTATR